MGFLFADLYLRFSKFISKAGYEIPVRQYIVVLEVSVFSVLFHCNHKCTQFSYSVIYTKNQVFVDPAKFNAYNLFPEKTVFFYWISKTFLISFRLLQVFRCLWPQVVADRHYKAQRVEN